MPEASENCLSLVNLCIYYAHQTRELDQLLSYSVDFPGSFEIHWLRQYLVNVILFRIKDPWTSETRKIRTPPFWDTPRRLKYKVCGWSEKNCSQ